MTTAKLNHSITSAAPLKEQHHDAGGRIANMGVHGRVVEKLGYRNISITCGWTRSPRRCCFKVEHSGWLQPNKLVTYRFVMDDKMKA